MKQQLFYVIRIKLFLFFICSVENSNAQAALNRVTGYAGIVHPIVTLSGQKTTTNFKDHYIVGLPVGINVWKTNNVGFSCEFVPYIKSENGLSKMNNFLFHPGVVVKLNHNYLFAGRLAFETSGRFGFTPVINRTVKRGKNCSYFIAVPFPVRFGNNASTSITAAFQFGIAF